MNLKLLLLYLTFNFFLSNVLFAATPPKYRHGELKAFLNTEFFSTVENYNNTGGLFTKLGSNSEFSFFKITPRAQYGLNRNWGLSGSFDFVSGTSTQLSTTRKTNTLTDISASLFYKLAKKSFYILPQIKLDFPIATFDEAQTDLILNEGAISAELGFWIEKKWLAHRFFIYAGYNYMTDGRAHKIPFELGVYNAYKGFVYGLSIAGNEVAKNDEFLATPEKRENRTDQLNAGSKKFYAINSKILNATGWLGYRVSKNIIVTGKILTSVNGSNAAKGNSYNLNIKWRAINPYKKNKIRDEKEFKLDGLENKTESDDSQ